MSLRIAPILALVVGCATLAKEPAPDAALGEKHYKAMCAVCHGENGEGFVADNASRLNNPDFLRVADDTFLYKAIAEGRSGTVMSAWGADRGGPLSKHDVESVIVYMRSWAPLPVAPPPQPPTAQPKRPDPLPLGPVPMNPSGPEPVGFQTHPAMTAVAVVRLAFEGKAKFALLDARPPTDYANEHISGAVSVPFYAPDMYFPKLPKDAWLVAYCACPHAESGKLAEKLMLAGFDKVTVLDEGFLDWKRKGYPTTKGRLP